MAVLTYSRQGYIQGLLLAKKKNGSRDVCLLRSILAFTNGAAKGS